MAPRSVLLAASDEPAGEGAMSVSDERLGAGSSHVTRRSTMVEHTLLPDAESGKDLGQNRLVDRLAGDLADRP